MNNTLVFNVLIMGSKSLGYRLLVRQCYKELVAIISTGGSFVLTGNPGIGKSMFAIYLIWYLLQNGKP